jgi:hypothetical protein
VPDGFVEPLVDGFTAAVKVIGALTSEVPFGVSLMAVVVAVPPTG